MQVVVCALSAAAGARAAEPDIETPAPPPAQPPRVEAKGLNLIVSGLFAPERDRMSYGFLLGGGYESYVGYNIDLNFGMSFQRIATVAGPVTLANLVDVTVARRAPTAVLLGAGIGAIFAGNGNAQFGAKVSVGAEFFHLTAVPVQVAFELIMKFCGDDPVQQCQAGDKQAWLAGRIGFRL